MKFKKKPFVIDAINNDNPFNVIQWAEQFIDSEVRWKIEGSKIIIPTLEGQMTAEKGDWVIRGTKGEYYPCKPDIFIDLYEPVEHA